MSQFVFEKVGFLRNSTRTLIFPAPPQSQQQQLEQQRVTPAGQSDRVCVYENDKLKYEQPVARLHLVLDADETELDGHTFKGVFHDEKSATFSCAARDVLFSDYFKLLQQATHNAPIRSVPARVLMPAQARVQAVVADGAEEKEEETGKQQCPLDTSAASFACASEPVMVDCRKWGAQVFDRRTEMRPVGSGTGAEDAGSKEEDAGETQELEEEHIVDRGARPRLTIDTVSILAITVVAGGILDFTMVDGRFLRLVFASSADATIVARDFQVSRNLIGMHPIHLTTADQPVIPPEVMGRAVDEHDAIVPARVANGWGRHEHVYLVAHAGRILEYGTVSASADAEQNERSGLEEKQEAEEEGGDGHRNSRDRAIQRATHAYVRLPTNAWCLPSVFSVVYEAVRPQTQLTLHMATDYTRRFFFVECVHVQNNIFLRRPTDLGLVQQRIIPAYRLSTTLGLHHSCAYARDVVLVSCFHKLMRTGDGAEAMVADTIQQAANATGEANGALGAGAEKKAASSRRSSKAAAAPVRCTPLRSAFADDMPLAPDMLERAMKLGALHEPLHPEFEAHFLEHGLQGIQNMVDLHSELKRYLSNVPPFGLNHRDRQLTRQLLLMLDPQFVEPLPTNIISAVLAILHRILFAKAAFDEVPKPEYRDAIKTVFRLLRHDDDQVALMAALVVRALGIQRCDSRTARHEPANRKAIFSPHNIRSVVTACFSIRPRPLRSTTTTATTSSSNAATASPVDSATQHTMAPQEGNLHHQDDGDGEDAVALEALSPREAASLGVPTVALEPRLGVTALLMTVLEALLVSGARVTDKKIVKEVQAALIGKDESARGYLDILFRCTQLPCSMLRCDATRVICALLHASAKEPEQQRKIQDMARESALLLWHTHLALDETSSSSQRQASDEMMRLLIRDNVENMRIVLRCFPPGVCGPVPPALRFDEFGMPLWSLLELQNEDSHAFSNVLFLTVFRDIRSPTVIWDRSMIPNLRRVLEFEVRRLESLMTRYGKHSFRWNENGYFVYTDGDRADGHGVAHYATHGSLEAVSNPVVEGEVKVGPFFLSELNLFLSTVKHAGMTAAIQAVAAANLISAASAGQGNAAAGAGGGGAGSAHSSLAGNRKSVRQTQRALAAPSANDILSYIKAHCDEFVLLCLARLVEEPDVEACKLVIEAMQHVFPEYTTTLVTVPVISSVTRVIAQRELGAVEHMSAAYTELVDFIGHIITSSGATGLAGILVDHDLVIAITGLISSCVQILGALPAPQPHDAAGAAEEGQAQDGEAEMHENAAILRDEVIVLSVGCVSLLALLQSEEPVPAVDTAGRVVTPLAASRAHLLEAGTIEDLIALLGSGDDGLRARIVHVMCSALEGLPQLSDCLAERLIWRLLNLMCTCDLSLVLPIARVFYFELIGCHRALNHVHDKAVVLAQTRLLPYLPKSLVRLLASDGPEAFSLAFVSNTMSCGLMWTDTSRDFLRRRTGQLLAASGSVPHSTPLVVLDATQPGMSIRPKIKEDWVTEIMCEANLLPSLYIMPFFPEFLDPQSVGNALFDSNAARARLEAQEAGGHETEVKEDDDSASDANCAGDATDDSDVAADTEAAVPEPKTFNAPQALTTEQSQRNAQMNTNMFMDQVALALTLWLSLGRKMVYVGLDAEMARTASRQSLTSPIRTPRELMVVLRALQTALQATSDLSLSMKSMAVLAHALVRVVREALGDHFFPSVKCKGPPNAHGWIVDSAELTSNSAAKGSHLQLEVATSALEAMQSATACLHILVSRLHARSSFAISLDDALSFFSVLDHAPHVGTATNVLAIALEFVMLFMSFAGQGEDSLEDAYIVLTEVARLTVRVTLDADSPTQTASAGGSAGGGGEDSDRSCPALDDFATATQEFWYKVISHAVTDGREPVCRTVAQALWSTRVVFALILGALHPASAVSRGACGCVHKIRGLVRRLRIKSHEGAPPRSSKVGTAAGSAGAGAGTSDRRAATSLLSGTLATFFTHGVLQDTMDSWRKLHRVLHSKVETPAMFWTPSMRAEAHDYVHDLCRGIAGGVTGASVESEMQEVYSEAELRNSVRSYRFTHGEVIVRHVYLRVFVTFSEWQLADRRQFLTMVSDFLRTRLRDCGDTGADTTADGATNDKSALEASLEPRHTMHPRKRPARQHAAEVAALALLRLLHDNHDLVAFTRTDPAMRAALMDLLDLSLASSLYDLAGDSAARTIAHCMLHVVYLVVSANDESDDDIHAKQPATHADGRPVLRGPQRHGSDLAACLTHGLMEHAQRAGLFVPPVKTATDRTASTGVVLDPAGLESLSDMQISFSANVFTALSFLCVRCSVEDPEFSATLHASGGIALATVFLLQAGLAEEAAGTYDGGETKQAKGGRADSSALSMGLTPSVCRLSAHLVSCSANDGNVYQFVQKVFPEVLTEHLTTDVDHAYSILVANVCSPVLMWNEGQREERSNAVSACLSDWLASTAWRDRRYRPSATSALQALPSFGGADDEGAFGGLFMVEYLRDPGFPLTYRQREVFVTQCVAAASSALEGCSGALPHPAANLSWETVCTACLAVLRGAPKAHAPQLLERAAERDGALPRVVVREFFRCLTAEAEDESKAEHGFADMGTVGREGEGYGQGDGVMLSAFGLLLLQFSRSSVLRGALLTGLHECSVLQSITSRSFQGSSFASSGESVVARVDASIAMVLLLLQVLLNQQSEQGTLLLESALRDDSSAHAVVEGLLRIANDTTAKAARRELQGSTSALSLLRVLMRYDVNVQAPASPGAPQAKGGGAAAQAADDEREGHTPNLAQEAVNAETDGVVSRAVKRQLDAADRLEAVVRQAGSTGSWTKPVDDVKMLLPEPPSPLHAQHLLHPPTRQSAATSEIRLESVLDAVQVPQLLDKRNIPLQVAAPTPEETPLTAPRPAAQSAAAAAAAGTVVGADADALGDHDADVVFSALPSIDSPAVVPVSTPGGTLRTDSAAIEAELQRLQAQDESNAEQARAKISSRELVPPGVAAAMVEASGGGHAGTAANTTAPGQSGASQVAVTGESSGGRSSDAERTVSVVGSLSTATGHLPPPPPPPKAGRHGKAPPPPPKKSKTVVAMPPPPPRPTTSLPSALVTDLTATGSRSRVSSPSVKHDEQQQQKQQQPARGGGLRAAAAAGAAAASGAAGSGRPSPAAGPGDLLSQIRQGTHLRHLSSGDRGSANGPSGATSAGDGDAGGNALFAALQAAMSDRRMATRDSFHEDEDSDNDWDS